MRILQINAVYATKSTGRTCKEFHDWALRNGHEVLTVYGNEPIANMPETEAIYLGTPLEHKLHAVTGRLFSDAGIGSWHSTRQLLHIIDDYKPDVVMLGNLHGNFVHIPMLQRFLANEDIPMAVKLDDCFWFTGGCMHYTVNGCYGWRKDCRGCKHLKRGKNYLLFNRASTALRRKKELFGAIPRLAVIGVSKWTAEQAVQSAVFGKTSIVDYVYNWIDLEVFRPKGKEKDKATRAALGIKDYETMVLGVASGWGLNKGLDHFIRLREKLPPSVHICLVGNMESDLKLPPGIMALGATESMERLAELYSAADVFVHLSLEETFGKVTAEALACGTPAVVYDSTASPELVSEDTGSVVSPGDIDAVAAAIPRLAAAAPAAACLSRAAGLFNLDTNCRKKLEIYEKLVNEHSK